LPIGFIAFLAAYFCLNVFTFIIYEKGGPATKARIILGFLCPLAIIYLLFFSTGSRLEISGDCPTCGKFNRGRMTCMNCGGPLTESS